MIQSPDFIEIEFSEVKGNINSPNFEEKTRVVLFEKVEDYELVNSRMIAYTSDEDQDFLFEIDTSIDRIISAIYTDEKGISKSLEIERIKDVESMNF